MSTLRALLISPPATSRRWDRSDFVAIALGALVGAWILAFKLVAFARLAYRDDLFCFTQLATSWIEKGELLSDHHYTSHLGIHTFFALVPLGLLAEPLGPRGLLLALAIAAAASVPIAARFVRARGVPGPAAIGFALALVLQPLSVNDFHDPIYGFHPELLAPPIALALMDALSAKRAARAVVLALAIIIIKEEMALLVATIALVALVEDRLAKRPRNGLALATLAIAALALPALVLFITSHRASGSSVGLTERIAAAHGVSSMGALAAHAIAHPIELFSSTAVLHYFVFAALATLGLAAIRPHLLALGLPLASVAWLVNDSIVWPARFAMALSLAWIIAALGFASLCETLRARPARARALAALFALGALASITLQSHALPDARDVYAFTPRAPYPDAELALADELFPRAYQPRPGEPVIAAPPLFRFARTSDLYWAHVLWGKPAPVWILWDDATPLASFSIDEREYQELARSGRFSVKKRKRAE